MKSLVKKLVTLFLLTALVYNSQAQTKEETEKFISKWVNEAIGMKTYGWLREEKVKESVIIRNDFSLQKLYLEKNTTDYKRGEYSENRTYTNLNWGNVTKIVIDTNSKYLDGNLACISIYFSTPVLHVSNTIPGTYNIEGHQTDYDWYSAHFLVPKSRCNSTKKALEHLVKLYKEEEKNNPFGN